MKVDTDGFAMSNLPTLDIRTARRLAILKAGLWRARQVGLPERGVGEGKRARRAALAVIDHFGYLQLDTVAVAGARTHAIVLASRLEGLRAGLAETLLRRGEPLFEYWGHEACWLPLSLYPLFSFRRREFARHPWWGDLINEHPRLARSLLDRARLDGPFRSVDLEGEHHPGWWNVKLAKRVAEALWSSGELAIAERSSFQRTYDLTERVIPSEVRAASVSDDDAYAALLLKALGAHGFATTGLLAATWRLRNRRPVLEKALQHLTEAGEITPAVLSTGRRNVAGWLTTADVERLDTVAAARMRGDRGVVLSPFDPLLWDRARVLELFGFEQVLEIYKPASQRQYGYYCMPILSGDRLVARVDLKADRGAGTVSVRATHYEQAPARYASRDRAAVASALARYAGHVELELA
ncbi:MAG: crosslink repair DNA glycosylase YcaQ family protein [Pseudomonadota bacterium]